MHTETIRTRQDFLAFFDRLRAELEAAPDAWENADLPRFLEAFGAWIADSDGANLSAGLAAPQDMSWGYLADALRAATLYE